MTETTQGWGRETPYRQGSVLAAEIAIRLLELHSGDDFAILISHDCDIANDNLIDEPYVEVIIARAIQSIDGNFAQAKNTRRLHLEFLRNGQPFFFEMMAIEKKSIKKTDLIGTFPDNSFSVSDSNRYVLQRWLAARYRRHAFPDTLNNRMSPVFEGANNKLKKSADDVLGIFIDYQPRNEELPEQEPYELWVYVVSNTAESGSSDRAQTIAESLSSLIAASQGLELIECIPIADTEFTLKNVRDTFEFRLEHLSFRKLPFGTTAEH